jgi:thymidine phosphorylase
MVAIGTHAGVRTEAFITDMDAPLGRAIGNSVEIIECIETLKGKGPADVADVSVRFAARMVVMAGVESDHRAAMRRVEDALHSGRALETFRRMIEAQGGDARIIDDYSVLPLAPDVEVVRAPRSGYVVTMKAGSLGRASNVLGAGRAKVGEPVDHGVGVVTSVSRGERIEEGEPLLELRHRGGRGLEVAMKLCRSAVRIADDRPTGRDKVLGEVR